MRPATDTRREKLRQRLSRDVEAWKAKGHRIRQIPAGESVPTRTWVLNPEWEERRHV